MSRTLVFLSVNMGCAASAGKKEAIERSKQISQTLKMNDIQAKRQVKILLLGKLQKFLLMDSRPILLFCHTLGAYRV